MARREQVRRWNPSFAAGLAADGQSRLAPLETVERGYGQLVERLQRLGAKVAKLP